MTENTRLIEYFDYMFDEINEKIYGNDLKKPVIIIAPTKNEPIVVSDSEVWRDKEDGEMYYEMAISPEALRNDMYTLFGYMLHACCHEFAHIFGYMDTKNDKGVNHLEEFAIVAREHGLNCEKAPKIGYAVCTVNDDALTVYNQLKEYEPKLFAEYPLPPEKDKEEVVKYRYKCPECKNHKFTIKFQIQNAICEECGSKLIEEVIEPTPADEE